MEPFNILDLSDVTIKKILEYADNDKNLGLTCFKFWEFICSKNRENESLLINTHMLMNPLLDLDHAFESSKIALNIYHDSTNINNLDEKMVAFLQTYGHRVATFGTSIYLNHFMTKLLPLLSNVELIWLQNSFALENQEFEKFSVKIKQLDLGNGINKECLELFDVERLTLGYLRRGHMERYAEVIKNWRNLKKVTFDHCSMEINTLKALKGIKLEVLEIKGMYDDGQKSLGNMLRKQKNLKEFHNDNISRKVFTIVCDNLKNLEVLNIDFIETISARNFQKISQLTKLKTLKVTVNSDCWNELTKTKSLENLENLNIGKETGITREDFLSLKAKFSNLKTLEINFNGIHVPFEVFATILEQFNQLICLKLHNFELLTFDEELLTQSHPNLNLKKLHINSSFWTNSDQLIPKIIRDYPNLENIGILKEISEENLTMLLTELKNLKKIADYEFPHTQIEILKQHGQKLKKFRVDMEELKNPNELLKDCGVSFYNHYNYDIKIISGTRGRKREKLIWNGLAFTKYCEWKKLKTMMDSRREIKSLFINLSSEITLENFKQCLEVFAQSVKIIVLYSVETYYDLKIILDVFRNCEELHIVTEYLFAHENDIFNIENSKLKIINFDCNSYCYENHMKELDFFLKVFKLQKCNLEKFIVTGDYDYFIKDKSVAEIREKCIVHLPKLTVVHAGFNETLHKYTIELNTN